MISCRITLVSVAVLLMSLPRRGESGCASYDSHCVFVDGMFRNAALCTRGTERFMVCCEAGHDYVPLNQACVGMYVETRWVRTVT